MSLGSSISWVFAVNSEFSLWSIKDVVEVRLCLNQEVCVCSVMTDPMCQSWFCNPMDCSPPGSSVCGIFRVRILEWVALSFSRSLRMGPMSLVSPALVGRLFTNRARVSDR